MNVGMFKTEYELFWVNLAMTPFMFRPDGYISCFMKKIISAICRTIIMGGSRRGISGTYPLSPPFYRCSHLKYSESMHTTSAVNV